MTRFVSVTEKKASLTLAKGIFWSLKRDEKCQNPFQVKHGYFQQWWIQQDSTFARTSKRKRKAEWEFGKILHKEKQVWTPSPSHLIFWGGRGTCLSSLRQKGNLERRSKIGSSIISTDEQTWSCCWLQPIVVHAFAPTEPVSEQESNGAWVKFFHNLECCRETYIQADMVGWWHNLFLALLV